LISSRGDKTAIELFLTGIWGWEAGLRRKLENGKSEETSNGYVKACMITGNSTGGPACCVVLGSGRFLPSSDDDLTSVDEIVA
jgi:hypothetical protein